jgi:hypothetical protein
MGAEVGDGVGVTEGSCSGGAAEANQVQPISKLVRTSRILINLAMVFLSIEPLYLVSLINPVEKIKTPN